MRTRWHIEGRRSDGTGFVVYYTGKGGNQFVSGDPLHRLTYSTEANAQVRCTTLNHSTPYHGLHFWTREGFV